MCFTLPYLIRSLLYWPQSTLPFLHKLLVFTQIQFLSSQLYDPRFLFNNGISHLLWHALILLRSFQTFSSTLHSCINSFFPIFKSAANFSNYVLIVSSGSLIKQTPLLIFLNLPLVFPFYLIWVTIQEAISQKTRTSILDKLGYLKKQIFLSVC